MRDSSERGFAAADRFSDFSQWKTRLTDLPDLRWEKVAAIREAIRTGTYDEAMRIDSTLRALEDDLE